MSKELLESTNATLANLNHEVLELENLDTVDVKDVERIYSIKYRIQGVKQSILGAYYLLDKYERESDYNGISSLLRLACDVEARCASAIVSAKFGLTVQEAHKT